jgi:hypothetical protein
VAQQAHEGPIRLPIQRAASDEAADELIDGADTHTGTVPPESDLEAVPDGPEVGRLAGEKVRLHAMTIEHSKNYRQEQK